MKGVSNNYLPQHQSPTKQEPQHDWWHLSQSPQQATSQGVKWASFMPESCALIEDNPSLKQECEEYFARQSPAQAPTQHVSTAAFEAQVPTRQGVKWASFMPESCALIEDNPSLKQECENHFAGQPTQHLLPNNPRHKAHKAEVHVDRSHFTSWTKAQGVH